MQAQTFYLPLQKLLLPRQKLINKILLGISICLVVFWMVTSVGVLFFSWQVFRLLLELGNKLSIVALLLFCLTLTPGIIQRLRILPAWTLPIATLITPFRRQIGIMMYVVALMHMSFSSTLFSLALVMRSIDFLGLVTAQQKIQTALLGVFRSYQVYEVVALIAMMLLFPVWITSNDVSQKTLGKWWKRLQRLTYVALWFIMLHVALQGEGWSVVAGAYLVMEGISWIVFWWRKRQARPSLAQPTAAPSATSAVE